MSRRTRKSLVSHSAALVLVPLLPLAVVNSSRAEEIAIVADGSSQYVIAVAEEAESRRINEAAAFLQETICRSTGVTLPVVRESDVEQGTRAIYLGRTQAARQAGIDVESAAGWSYSSVQ